MASQNLRRGRVCPWREGGAEHAVQTMQTLLDGFQSALPSGLVIVPQRLPTLGYHSQEDTHLLLGLPDGSDSWYHGDNQNRIGQDFIQRSLDNQAVVTQAEADTIQVRLERDPEAWRVDETAPTEVDAEGLKQTMRVVTVAFDSAQATAPDSAQATQATAGESSPERSRRQGVETWFDSDGDGWLEQTTWTEHAVLSLDRDGDGLIRSATELVSADSGHDSLEWLDANGDGRLDANDPAYSALRLWTDVNGDGISQADEMLTLTDAGIESFALEADGIHARTATGELATGEQSLAGEVIGERWQSAKEDGTEIGILHDTEDGTHELYAVRTHDYTGEAGHSHGGKVRLKSGCRGRAKTPNLPIWNKSWPLRLSLRIVINTH